MSPAAEVAFLTVAFPKTAHRLAEFVLEHGNERGVELFSESLIAATQKPQRTPRAPRCQFTDQALRLSKERAGRGLTRGEERQIKDFFAINKDNQPEMLWEHFKVQAMKPNAFQGDWPIHEFVKTMATIARSQKLARVTNNGTTRSKFAEWQG